ncbi:uncharacterized protein STAUR_8113 [Stigmatella aurantiaca DW4/3-1]|uniref:Uncharacterized protein n=1 Tax=Stigmatella aurantiaca (strain DW4/3-1) TaxID=378806 RepID=E3FT58_STIAD|nr:uncharacterized protein STAUR_8113 [Stigmatella aurantiaca DW4/3-1]
MGGGAPPGRGRAPGRGPRPRAGTGCSARPSSEGWARSWRSMASSTRCRRAPSRAARGMGFPCIPTGCCSPWVFSAR